MLNKASQEAFSWGTCSPSESTKQRVYSVEVHLHMNPPSKEPGYGPVHVGTLHSPDLSLVLLDDGKWNWYMQ